MPPIRPGSLAFVLLMAALMSMSAMTIDINLPAIPATAHDLGAPTRLAQLTVTVFFVGFALGQAVYGPVSDRFGRKPVLLVGVVLFIASSLACALAPDIATLLAMRLVQGLGAGAGPVIGRAMIRDLFEGREMARIMSFSMAAFITAPIIAPSIGALVLSLASWRWIFLFLAVYGAVILALAGLLVTESLRRPDPQALRPRRIAGAWLAVLRHRESVRYGGVVTFGLTALIVYLANASPLFMSVYGLSAGEFGLVFAGIAVCSALGSLANARLVHRLPLRRAIGIGLGLGGLALALSLAAWLSGLDNAWSLLPGFAGFFFSFGLIVSNATTLALAPHGAIVGAASAALGVAQSLVSAGIASLVTAAFDGTPLPALAAMLLLLTASGGLLARAGRAQP
jgi:DHA1 family bicyclomycin/chloramphenicol resistance-like MFS transporter